MTATMTDTVTFTYDGATYEYPIGSHLPDDAASVVRRLRDDRGYCAGRVFSHETEIVGYRGQHPGTSWACSLPVHDDAQPHVALSGGLVLGTWGGFPPEVDEEKDPDPAPFELVEGTIYKFRNRKTMLMYVRTRPDGQVEVLDMTHERWRVLDRGKLVPRPEGSEPPTPEQMQWIGKFMAERRAQVRKNALKQRQDGYFKTEDELNSVLRELSLAPLEEMLVGTANVGVTFTVPAGMTKEQAKAAINAWKEKLPSPDGIGVELSLSLSIRSQKA